MEDKTQLDSGEWIIRQKEARHAENLAVLESQEIERTVGFTNAELNTLGRFLRRMGYRPSMTRSEGDAILYKIGR